MHGGFDARDSKLIAAKRRWDRTELNWGQMMGFDR